MTLVVLDSIQRVQRPMLDRSTDIVLRHWFFLHRLRGTASRLGKSGRSSVWHPL